MVMEESATQRKIKARVATQIDRDAELARQQQDEEKARIAAEKEREVLDFLEAQRLQNEQGLGFSQVKDTAEEYDPTDEDIEYFIKTNPEVNMKALQLLTDQSLNEEQMTAQIKEFIKMRYYQTMDQFTDSLKKDLKKPKQLTQAQVTYQMKKYCCHVGNWKMHQFKGISHDQVKRIYYREVKRDKNFIPMDTEIVMKKYPGHKRAGDDLESKTPKKPKFSKEQLEEMMEVVPEVLHVDPISTKYPVISWSIYTDQFGKGLKITRANGESAIYKSFEDLVRGLDREDLNKVWSLVQETISNESLVESKQQELWVKLKRMYEPDPSDRYWRFRAFDRYTTWRMYDSGVHHVSTTEGTDVFMLPELEYPLHHGVLTVLLSTRLKVEDKSEMARNLILKIQAQSIREDKKLR